MPDGHANPVSHYTITFERKSGTKSTSSDPIMKLTTDRNLWKPSRSKGNKKDWNWAMSRGSDLGKRGHCLMERYTAKGTNEGRKFSET
jgi:hypothetical protein